MLPESLAPSLRGMLSRARAWWLKDGPRRSGVALPRPLERKHPRAGHSRPVVLGFAQHTSTDHGAIVVRRHHMYDRTFQRAFKRAVEQAGITKPAAPHASATRSRRRLLRSTVTTHSNRAGSARPFRRLYDDDLHACAESWRCRVRSPLDALPPSLVRR